MITVGYFMYMIMTAAKQIQMPPLTGLLRYSTAKLQKKSILSALLAFFKPHKKCNCHQKDVFGVAGRHYQANRPWRLIFIKWLCGEKICTFGI